MSRKRFLPSFISSKFHFITTVARKEKWRCCSKRKMKIIVLLSLLLVSSVFCQEKETLGVGERWSSCSIESEIWKVCEIIGNPLGFRERPRREILHVRHVSSQHWLIECGVACHSQSIGEVSRASYCFRRRVPIEVSDRSGSLRILFDYWNRTARSPTR